MYPHPYDMVPARPIDPPEVKYPTATCPSCKAKVLDNETDWRQCQDCNDSCCCTRQYQTVNGVRTVCAACIESYEKCEGCGGMSRDLIDLNAPRFSMIDNPGWPSTEEKPEYACEKCRAAKEAHDYAAVYKERFGWTPQELGAAQDRVHRYLRTVSEVAHG